MAPVILLLCAVVAAAPIEPCLAFSARPAIPPPPSTTTRVPGGRPRLLPTFAAAAASSAASASASTTALSLAAGSSDGPVEISFPTPDDAAAMGVRDWPQMFRSESWTDAVPEGGIASRYVLDGTGRLTVDYYDDFGERKRMNARRVYPGTLVEVDGEATLLWEVDDAREGMVILTPGYEEGGTLLLVGGLLAVFCAGLLVGSGGL